MRVSVGDLDSEPQLLTLVLVTALTFANGAAAATRPDPVKTRAFIDYAWGALTRSLEDCSALADNQVSSHAVLYLPAKMPVPAKLPGIAKRYGVGLRTLPRVVDKLGDT